MFEFSQAEIIMLAVPTVLFLTVLELVRSRRLREDYSLLWMATSIILIILGIFRNSLLDWVAGIMGIFYPPTALFVLGFFLMMLILLQFSMVITRLSNQNRQSAQHIALLTERLHRLEQKLADHQDD